jgi:hypothetical protein
VYGFAYCLFLKYTRNAMQMKRLKKRCVFVRLDCNDAHKAMDGERGVRKESIVSVCCCVDNSSSFPSVPSVRVLRLRNEHTQTYAISCPSPILLFGRDREFTYCLPLPVRSCVFRIQGVRSY